MASRLSLDKCCRYHRHAHHYSGRYVIICHVCLRLFDIHGYKRNLNAVEKAAIKEGKVLVVGRTC